MNKMIHLVVPAELVRQSGINLNFTFRVYAEDHRLIIEQPYCCGDCQSCREDCGDEED